MAESFFATLECELLVRQTFRTLREARTALFEYIEVFYNRQRRHSALDYLSPDDYERRWTTQTSVVAYRTTVYSTGVTSNMACPSLRTTNDMPIVQPRSFEAFGLLPFQINPHYRDPDPNSTHQGETRAARIAEFLEENDVTVLGMREGSWLRRNGPALRLEGVAGARLFMRNAEPQEIAPGMDLSWLLEAPAHFDQRM